MLRWRIKSTDTVFATAAEEGMCGQTTESAGASDLIALAGKKRAQQQRGLRRSRSCCEHTLDT